MTELLYTVGPQSLGRHADLLVRGATGVRLTFSFGTHGLQLGRAEELKSVGRNFGRPVHVMADLGGEKFRMGTFSGPASVSVRAGQIIRLFAEAFDHSRRADGPETNLPISGSGLFEQAQHGDTLTVGDGEVDLVVQKVGPDALVGIVSADGVIDQCRGLVLRDSRFRPRSLTEKDRADLDVIVASDAFDSVALSFVATADEVAEVRRLVRRSGRNLLVAAKIETEAGLDHLDAIAAEADVLVAARGDLALAIDWVELPEAVERIASAAQSRGKPWWLATQILSGLDHYAMPTRAEISDAAHWLRSGCSGLILCRETAFGAHPEEAVACAARLIKRWGGRMTERDEAPMLAGRPGQPEMATVLPEGEVP